MLVRRRPNNLPNPIANLVMILQNLRARNESSVEKVQTRCSCSSIYSRHFPNSFAHFILSAGSCKSRTCLLFMKCKRIQTVTFKNRHRNSSYRSYSKGHRSRKSGICMANVSLSVNHIPNSKLVTLQRYSTEERGYAPEIERDDSQGDTKA